MKSREEIYRLVKLNKQLIVSRLQSEEVEYLFLIDKKLIEIFQNEMCIVSETTGIDKNQKGAMLTVDREAKILDIENNVDNLKIFVLAEEYNRMKKQLSLISSKTIADYQKMFGYSKIVFEGSGEILREIERKADVYNKDMPDRDALHITEYIDTRKHSRDIDGHYLGIRQFLFELEVFASFPAEVAAFLDCKEKFVGFLGRFLDIFEKTEWQIVFSEKSPLIDKLLCGRKHTFYLEDFNMDQANGSKIIIIENGNVTAVEKFYRKYRKTAWVVIRRLIVLFRAWIMEILCDYFRNELKKKDVELYLVNWNWALNHPLFPAESITSVQMEERESYNLYKIRNNQEDYQEFLKKIYGEKYTEEYADQIMDIPNKIELEPGKIRHENCMTPYINVINGERRTEGQPLESKNSIYMLGGCVFFGYAVEDRETIASFLQKKISQSSGKEDWRVVNMGTWGGNIDQTYKTIYDLKFRPGDIVVISYAGYMPLGDNYEEYDISTALNSPSMAEGLYFNSLVHCNHVGYEKVAERLWNMLQKKLVSNNRAVQQDFYLSPPKQAEDSVERQYTLQAEEYIKQVKEAISEDWNTGTCGAIVMNCNPFTLGHKYLIQQSAKKVDHLYIFVVEEDKSFFPFKDRIELVRAGTRDIENVVVVPSGKLIISSVTFPGYFLKDTPEAIGVDTSQDVDIFAKYIAGPLRIKKRFVGEEPIDLVTRSYNQSMKEILPRYGIEVDEIKRKEEAGDVISASRVRRALKTGDFETIQKLVPATTYEYLVKRKEQYLEK